jgi:hypothetical protein
MGSPATSPEMFLPSDPPSCGSASLITAPRRIVSLGLSRSLSSLRLRRLRPRGHSRLPSPSFPPKVATAWRGRRECRGFRGPRVAGCRWQRPRPLPPPRELLWPAGVDSLSLGTSTWAAGTRRRGGGDDLGFGLFVVGSSRRPDIAVPHTHLLLLHRLFIFPFVRVLHCRLVGYNHIIS